MIKYPEENKTNEINRILEKSRIKHTKSKEIKLHPECTRSSYVALNPVMCAWRLK